MRSLGKEDVKVVNKGDGLLEKVRVRNLERAQFEVGHHLNLNCERFVKMEVH